MSSDFKLSLDAWARLVLTEGDRRHVVGIEPVRAFPLSDPAHGVALCDAEGHEVAWIEDLGELAPDTRQLLESELARREFVPIVQRIVRISSDTAPSEWDVQTDRGGTQFTLKNEDDVRRLGLHRVLITDAQGLRYHVPDVRELDAVSRRMLERYL